VAIVAIKSRLLGLDIDKNIVEEQLYRISMADQLRSVGYRSTDIAKRAKTAALETDRERKWRVGGSRSPQRSPSRPSTIPVSWPEMPCNHNLGDPIILQSGLDGTGACVPPRTKSQGAIEAQIESNSFGNDPQSSSAASIPIVIDDWSSYNKMVSQRFKTPKKVKRLSQKDYGNNPQPSSNLLNNKSSFCGTGLGMRKPYCFPHYEGRTGSAKAVLAQILSEKGLQ
jgi:hypothetical protein